MRASDMAGTFKDWAAADIPGVFFDTSEFADTLTINDTSVDIVWDKDSLEYKRIKDLAIGDVSEILYVNVHLPYYYFNVIDPDGNVLEITGKYEV